MASGTFQYDSLVYKKGFDPLGFKVTDPVALKEADFMLKIYDTAYLNNGQIISGAGALGNLQTLLIM
jgi:hypothetical protein